MKTITDLEKAAHNGAKNHLGSRYIVESVNTGKLSWEFLGVEYEDQEPLKRPTGLYEQCYDNGTDLEQGNTFKRLVRTKATFRWSITAGIKFGASTTVKVGLPVIAGGKVNLSTEISISGTVETIEEEEQIWEVNDPVRVPPHSAILGTLTVTECDHHVRFFARIVLNGPIHVTAFDRGKYHVVEGDFDAFEVLGNQPGFEPVCDVGSVKRGVIFTAEGEYEGVQGLDRRVILKQYPEGFCAGNAPWKSEVDKSNKLKVIF